MGQARHPKPETLCSSTHEGKKNLSKKPLTRRGNNEHSSLCPPRLRPTGILLSRKLRKANILILSHHAKSPSNCTARWSGVTSPRTHLKDLLPIHPPPPPPPPHQTLPPRSPDCTYIRTEREATDFFGAYLLGLFDLSFLRDTRSSVYFSHSLAAFQFNRLSRDPQPALLQKRRTRQYPFLQHCKTSTVCK